VRHAVAQMFAYRNGHERILANHNESDKACRTEGTEHGQSSTAGARRRGTHEIEKCNFSRRFQEHRSGRPCGPGQPRRARDVAALQGHAYWLCGLYYGKGFLCILILFPGCLLAIAKSSPKPQATVTVGEHDRAGPGPPPPRGWFDSRLFWLGLGRTTRRIVSTADSPITRLSRYRNRGLPVWAGSNRGESLQDVARAGVGRPGEPVFDRLVDSHPAPLNAWGPSTVAPAKKLIARLGGCTAPLKAAIGLPCGGGGVQQVNYRALPLSPFLPHPDSPG